MTTIEKKDPQNIDFAQKICITKIFYYQNLQKLPLSKTIKTKYPQTYIEEY